MNNKTLSAQMQAVLQLLESENLTARQINDRLYAVTSSASRRVFSASTSRTIRRMERRGLLLRHDEMVAITQSGRWTLHPEEYQSALEQSGQDARETVRRTLKDSPEIHELLRWAAEVQASWERWKKSKGY
jgi:hypothetical protein